MWLIPHKEELALDCQGTGEPLKNFKHGGWGGADMDKSAFEQIILAISERINWEG